jgi:hypothetical protein
MSEKGQALIILIVAAGLAISVLTTVAITALSLGKNTAKGEAGRAVYYVAESGAEYGILKLMRTPTCSGSDSFTVDQTSVTVTYNPAGSSCVVTATAQKGNIQKKILLEGSYDTNQVFNYCCWQEIP